MAPVMAYFWLRVSCTSPVPGGRSTMSASSSPQATWPISCCSAPWSIGPRQITASPSLSMRPIDMSVTPWAWSGMIVLPSGDFGRSLTPIMRGWLGP